MTRTLNKDFFKNKTETTTKNPKKQNQKVLNESAKALALVPPRQSHAGGGWDSAATFRKEKFHGAQVPFTSSHHEGRPALLVT